MPLEPLCSSSQFHYYAPLEKFDKACYELYCDERVMLPFLPQLYRMDEETFQERRKEHRLKFLKQSCFLDIIHRTTGDFVGTCGFREFRSIEVDGKDNLAFSRPDKTKAQIGSTRIGEFGVNICYRHQRKGICSEAFIQMLYLAKNQLNCSEIEGVTMTVNIPMRSFFEKFGLPIVKNVYIDKSGVRHDKQVTKTDVEHSVYQGNINHILSKHENTK